MVNKYKLKKTKNLMNKIESNGKFTKGHIVNEETRKKISRAMKGNKNGRFRINTKCSEETKKKISEANKGQVPWSKGKNIWKHKEHPRGMLGKTSWNKGIKCSEETKKKISEALKGREVWHKGKKMWDTREHPKGMLGKTPWNKGEKGLYKHSEESKRKLSENNGRYWKGKTTWIKGTHHSEETKRKIKLSNQGLKRSKETIDKIKIARAKQIFPIKDTKIELKIQDFLTLLKIEFITHKYMNIKNRYQADIFIPVQVGIPQKIIIECDGDFFHMNPNKFSPEDRAFKDGMTAEEKWKLDDSRTKQLLEKGYNVIRIWENEIRKMTLEDFKEKLMEVNI